MRIQLSDHFTYKKLLRFVLPSIIMMVFTSIYGVVDGLCVSNFVGKTPFAAINLIMPFVMIFGGIGRPYHLYFHDEITSFIVFVANVYNTILPQGILRHHLRRKILNTSDTLFRLQRSLTIMNGIFSVTQDNAMHIP